MLAFYPRYLWDLLRKHVKLAELIIRFGSFRWRLKRDPNARSYMDQALTPVAEDELETLEMFTASDSAKAAAAKVRRDMERVRATA
jgi:hypothetical protein